MKQEYGSTKEDMINLDSANGTGRGVVDARDPLVSVLVPAYNHAKYIEKTIDSIMQQSYRNFEVLIIDDGSRDDTAAVIRRCEEKWGRSFLVESQANMGLCKTLNKLLGHAKGEYINIIASDDWMLPEKLELQVNYLNSHPDVGVVHSDNWIFMEKKNRLEKSGRGRHVPSGWIFNDLLAGNCVTACSAMIRTDCYKRVGFYDETLAFEDWDMWLRIAREFEIHYMDIPTVVYRLHGKNSSDLMLHEMLQSIKALIQKHCPDGAIKSAHLLTIALGELNYFSITDARLAEVKFRELAQHWYKFKYLKAIPKYLLLRTKLLGLFR